MLLGKTFESMVIELTPQIALESFYVTVELGGYHTVEFGKGGECFRFIFKWVDPNKIRKIIYEDHLIFISSFAKYRRRP